MSFRLYTSVPIQYIIETKSDWTHFSIVSNGFWWSNIEVEYLKGGDKLAQDVLFSPHLMKIVKRRFDESIVKIAVNCRLNIDENHLNSTLQYRIEKGDIEYTIVKILIKGKEVECLENKHEITGNPRNPKDFTTSPKIKRPKSGIKAKIITGSKIVVLFGVGYIAIFLGIFTYCSGLSLDFSEFALANPYIIILGGPILTVPMVPIATKRNWI